MIVLKTGILSLLTAAGYNSTRIRKENILPQSTLTKLRRGGMINLITLDKLCELLECQPGELIKWVPGEGQDE